MSKKGKKIIGWQFQNPTISDLMTISIERLREKIRDDETFEMFYYDDQTKEGRLLTEFRISQD